MGALRVTTLPILSDNYAYLLEWDDGMAVVDPGEGEPVLEAVLAVGKPLEAILLTHYHGDHVAGLETVSRGAGCSMVLGPAEGKLPSVTRPMADGDHLALGPCDFQVMSTPGHSRSDTSLYAEAEGIVFVGDTMFCGGCGRMFEGPPETFHRSLQRLAALPEDTMMFCGHEYTLDNLAFTRSLNWRREEVARRLAAVNEGLAAGCPSVPSTIGEEMRTNPFLNVGDVGLQRILGAESDGMDAEVFARLRKRKDQF